MPTREQIEQTILDNRQNCFDTTVQTSTLKAEVTTSTKFRGTVENHEDTAVSFSGSAFSQLLSKIKIPGNFFNKCPNNLQEQIFNHFVDKEKQSYLLRMKPSQPKAECYDEGLPVHCRAVLTERYGMVDDHQLFPVIFSAVEGSDFQAVYQQFLTDENISQLYIHFPDATSEYNDMTYRSGVMVTNSETGHSSVWIEPVVYGNGINFQNRATLQKQGVKCRLVHRGSPQLTQVQEMITRARDIAQVGLLQAIEASQETVSKDYALAYTKSIDGLPRRFYYILQDEWQEQQDVARDQVARRIIQLAQELPLFQRISIEQSACAVTKVFNNFEARMLQIAEELSDED